MELDWRYCSTEPKSIGSRLIRNSNSKKKEGFGASNLKNLVSENVQVKLGKPSDLAAKYARFGSRLIDAFVEGRKISDLIFSVI